MAYEGSRPGLSAYFESRRPSAIRAAQIEFARRRDGAAAVNVAIGNVSLAMHPAMQDRMASLTAPDSPVRGGVVRYTPTVGLDETRDAFLHTIASCGFDTRGLYAQITDGSSMAMELTVLAVCGPAGSEERPLLVMDPAYTNYMVMADRTGRTTLHVARHLEEDGSFALPDLEEIEQAIEAHSPGGLLVIPYDNPTGQFCDHDTMVELARLCVEHNLWMVSDEAYRQLYYGDKEMSSVWRLSEAEVPGITGRRVSLESASKVFNACGLRIGAIITDNEAYHRQSVAEATANLCAPAIDQVVFGALAHVASEDLREWYAQQRAYYQPMMSEMVEEMTRLLPGIIISKPEAAIYSVVDVRRTVKPGFDAQDFVLYCAREGSVELDGESVTLLVSPMAGFYGVDEAQFNPGRTQMRIAYVVPPDEMRKVPPLFAELIRQYEGQRA